MKDEWVDVNKQMDKWTNIESEVLKDGKRTDGCMDGQTDSNTGRQTYRQIDKQAGSKQVDSQSYRQTDGWTGSKTVIQEAGRQMYRPAEIHTNIQTERQTDTFSNFVNF